MSAVLQYHLMQMSSCQDYYENLYAVVRGQKLFTLLPPWCHVLARSMSLDTIPVGCYHNPTARSSHHPSGLNDSY